MVVLSKENYVAIAAILKASTTKDEIMVKLIGYFKENNPAFDIKKFIVALGRISPFREAMGRAVGLNQELEEIARPLGQVKDPHKDAVWREMGVTEPLQRAVANYINLLIVEVRRVGQDIAGEDVTLVNVRDDPAKFGPSLVSVAELEWLLVSWHDGNWNEAIAWFRAILPAFRR